MRHQRRNREALDQGKGSLDAGAGSVRWAVRVVEQVGQRLLGKGCRELRMGRRWLGSWGSQAVRVGRKTGAG